jgi:hypothetical protein
MDEKPNEIMNHIEEQRDQLGRNLNELESRVRRTADWRAQFDRNPMLMMGVALGGGLLLGSIVGSSRKTGTNTSWSSSPRNYSSSSGVSSSASYTPASATPNYAYSSPALQEHRRKTNDTLEMIKAALIGFGTAKVKEFMSEALPGFHQHLEDAQRKHSSSNSEPGQQGSGYQSGSGSSQTGSYQGGSQPGTYGSQQGSSQYGSQQYGGSQSGGSTRTEHPAQTPYRQEPVGANPARNT